MVSSQSTRDYEMLIGYIVGREEVDDIFKVILSHRKAYGITRIYNTKYQELGLVLIYLMGLTST